MDTSFNPINQYDEIMRPPLDTAQLTLIVHVVYVILVGTLLTLYFFHYLCTTLCALLFSQPMEIYVDDEAKLTLHGLVQVQ